MNLQKLIKDKNTELICTSNIIQIWCNLTTDWQQKSRKFCCFV